MSRWWSEQKDEQLVPKILYVRRGHKGAANSLCFLEDVRRMEDSNDDAQVAKRF